MADANRPWTHAEREVVLEALPIHLKVPIALSMFTGLREGDALTITWSSYRDGNISTNTAKSGQPIWWRCPSTLAAILADAPRGDAVQIAINSYGQPWTESGFRASWRKIKVKLEAEGKVGPGLTVHGLRHTVATTLREEGFSLQAIADALGQKTTAMAGHYSKTADLQKSMIGVGEALDRAMNEKGIGNV
jgi:integrase